MAYGFIGRQNAILPQNIIGTLSTSQIPDLDASQITTGTFSASRIPNLSASKITSGTLPVSRGGTGVTSISALLNSLGLSVGLFAETINYNFIANYTYSETHYKNWSGSNTFTYNFNSPIVGCLLYLSNNYNPTISETPPSEISSLTNTFKQSHLLIVDSISSIKNPLYVYNNNTDQGYGNYARFEDNINVTLTQQSLTLNETVTGGAHGNPSGGFPSSNVTVTISGFVVPIYSN